MKMYSKNVHPIILSILAGACAASMALAQQGTPSRTAGYYEQLRAFLREPDGLRTAAQKFGKVVIDDSPEYWGEETLRSLTQKSETILVGQLASSHSELTDNGDNIQSRIMFDELDNVKGNFNGSSVDVVVPGGRIEFTPEQSAEVRTLESGALRKGERYLIFLKKTGSEFSPVGGAAGIFKISSTGDVVPVIASDTGSHALSHELRGEALPQLIASIREIH